MHYDLDWTNYYQLISYFFVQHFCKNLMGIVSLLNTCVIVTYFWCMINVFDRIIFYQFISYFFQCFHKYCSDYNEFCEYLCYCSIFLTYDKYVSCNELLLVCFITFIKILRNSILHTLRLVNTGLIDMYFWCMNKTSYLFHCHWLIT